MTSADPASLDLGALFRDEDMFDSRKAWSASGFRLVDRSDSGKSMVAGHSSVHGLLFKKYVNNTSHDQAAKIFRRLEDGDEDR